MRRRIARAVTERCTGLRAMSRIVRVPMAGGFGMCGAGRVWCAALRIVYAVLLMRIRSRLRWHLTAGHNCEYQFESMMSRAEGKVWVAARCLMRRGGL